MMVMGGSGWLQFDPASELEGLYIPPQVQHEYKYSRKDQLTLTLFNPYPNRPDSLFICCLFKAVKHSTQPCPGTLDPRLPFSNYPSQLKLVNKFGN